MAVRIHRWWKVEKVGGAEHCYLRGLSWGSGEIFEKIVPGD